MWEQRPRRGRIDQFFTVRKPLETRQTCSHLTILVWLDLKCTFNPIDPAVLFNVLRRQSVNWEHCTCVHVVLQAHSLKEQLHSKRADAFDKGAPSIYFCLASSSTS